LFEPYTDSSLTPTFYIYSTKYIRYSAIGSQVRVTEPI